MTDLGPLPLVRTGQPVWWLWMWKIPFHKIFPQIHHNRVGIIFMQRLIWQDKPDLQQNSILENTSLAGQFWLMVTAFNLFSIKLVPCSRFRDKLLVKRNHHLALHLYIILPHPTSHEKTESLPPYSLKVIEGHQLKRNIHFAKKCPALCLHIMDVQEPDCGAAPQEHQTPDNWVKCILLMSKNPVFFKDL